MHPRIKICCIKSSAEAAMAIAHGASAIGLVSAMPSGPGVISEEQIAQIAATVPPPIATFLLTCEHSTDTIIAQQRRCRTNTIQLVDYVATEVYPLLRAELPGIALVQVVHVTGPEAVDYAVAVAGHVDALLLDSGKPALRVKELGGTGRKHDWTLSRSIRDAVRVPVFLAGGLNSTNVAEAVAAVQPFGLDLCSGVRTDDRLDPVKLQAFFDATPDRDARAQPPAACV
jgi:phosphoribosylanthranilate isomerase